MRKTAFCALGLCCASLVMASATGTIGAPIAVLFTGPDHLPAHTAGSLFALFGAALIGGIANCRAIAARAAAFRDFAGPKKRRRRVSNCHGPVGRGRPTGLCGDDDCLDEGEAAPKHVVWRGPAPPQLASPGLLGRVLDRAKPTWADLSTNTKGVIDYV
jgi:hypothetical protein